jgi:hypothetical protein
VSGRSAVDDAFAADAYGGGERASATVPEVVMFGHKMQLTTEQIRQRLEDCYGKGRVPERLESALQVLEEADRRSPPNPAQVAAGWAVFDEVLQPWLERPKMAWSPRS